MVRITRNIYYEKNWPTKRQYVVLKRFKNKIIIASE